MQRLVYTNTALIQVLTSTVMYDRRWYLQDWTCTVGSRMRCVGRSERCAFTHQSSYMVVQRRALHVHLVIS
jgi:hypothetical protein